MVVAAPENQGNQPSVRPSTLSKSLAWMGSTAFLSQIVSWLFTLITARILAPSDFGLVALAETFLPYLSIVSTYGVAIWYVQAFGLSSRETQAACGFSWMLGGLMSLVAFVAAPSVAMFYRHEELIVPLRILALSFVFDAMPIIPRGLMRREMRYRELGLIGLWIAVTRSALQVGLALAGFGYMALVAGVLFKSIGEAVAVLYREPIWPRFDIGFPLVLRIVGYALPATLSMILWIIFSTADNLIVGRLFGVEALGFYSMAFYLSDMALSKFSTVVKPVALAHYSRVAAQGEELSSEFLVIAGNSCLVLFPILTGLAVTAPQAVPVVLGSKWAPMVPAFQVLCVVGILRFMTDSISTLLLSSAYPRRDLLINSVGVCILPPLFYLLGNRFGLKGIYCAWLGFYPLVVCVSVATLARTHGISIRQFWRWLKLPLTASALVAGGAALGSLLSPDSSTMWVLATKIVGGTLGGALVAPVAWRRVRDSLSSDSGSLPRPEFS